MKSTFWESEKPNFASKLILNLLFVSNERFSPKKIHPNFAFIGLKKLAHIISICLGNPNSLHNFKEILSTYPDNSSCQAFSQVSVKIFYLFPITFSQKTDWLYIDLIDLFKFLIIIGHIQELEIHNWVQIVVKIAPFKANSMFSPKA